MCGDGKESFRDCQEEDIPKPRTAEQLLEQARKKQLIRCQGPHATGLDWERDYLR